jgi:epoxide hydrolase 4
MDFEHSTIETNGIRLHVVQAGPKSGVPLLLLHGFPENWRCWIKQMPALSAASCRVIVPDQRGYNLSDKPKGIKNYRVEELTKDILGLIDALEYEKVNLVGHDFGALVAWMLAIHHPERLHRLGIINVPHTLRSCGDFFDVISNKCVGRYMRCSFRCRGCLRQCCASGTGA